MVALENHNHTLQITPEDLALCDANGDWQMTNRAVPLRPRTAKLFLTAFVALVLLAALVPLPESWRNRLWSGVFDLCHAPAFLVLTFLLLSALPAFETRRWLNMLAIPGSLIAVGLLLEAVQLFIGRHASLGDIFANFGGVFAGMMLYWASNQIWPSRRTLLVAAALAAMAVVMASPTRLVYDALRQRAAFPLLASFEDSLELERWWSRSCHIACAVEHVADGRHAAVVTLQTHDFPGIGSYSLLPDWTGFDYLEVVLCYESTSSDSTIRGSVNVFDHVQANGAYLEGFHRDFELANNQPQRIRIPLKSISGVRRSPPFELWNVRLLEVAFSNARNGQRVYVDDLRLSRNEVENGN